MEANSENLSHPQEFVLLGFSGLWELQNTLFAIFLILYLITITGNATVIVLIHLDSRLHTPMYFFLSTFSLVETLVITTIIPRMLVDLLTEKKTISFTWCLTQFYFYFSLGLTDFLLLAAMSIDRYVAICHPLHYSTIMSRHLCNSLVLGSLASAFLTMIPTTIWMARLSFCRSNVINHFFCDNVPLIKLSCSDTRPIELWDFLLALIFILSSLLVTIISYVAIISTILRIPSASSQQKAFSTCASHFTVVVIGYGSTIFIYVRPSKGSSMDINKMLSLLTSVLTPLLNPFIFTLRNKKVKEVFRDRLWKLRGFLGR
ncbi:PREDICTED: olfactory receptor 6V1 [Crocodylus porosus]|uniref:olfactory receptor 6V1 n=1 Tax=Crocodylus porosus TaxID=8502 RepID=UPI00093F451A|nr:PREDICTED: olfactory receptor 6V1 [Crocodylus porosus]